MCHPPIFHWEYCILLFKYFHSLWQICQMAYHFVWHGWWLIRFDKVEGAWRRLEGINADEKTVWGVRGIEPIKSLTYIQNVSVFIKNVAFQFPSRKIGGNGFCTYYKWYRYEKLLEEIQKLHAIPFQFSKAIKLYMQGPTIPLSSSQYLYLQDQNNVVFWNIHKK